MVVVYTSTLVFLYSHGGFFFPPPSTCRSLKYVIAFPLVLTPILRAPFSLSLYIDHRTTRHPYNFVAQKRGHPVLSLCLATLLAVLFLHSVATTCLYFLLESKFLQCRLKVNSNKLELTCTGRVKDGLTS